MLYKFGNLNCITPEIEKTFTDKYTMEFTDTVKKRLSNLDENYGDDRDIFNDDGGYIVIIEDQEDYDLFTSSEYVFNKENINDYEYCLPIADTNFVEILYLYNNDFGVIIIIPKDILTANTEIVIN